MFVRYQPSCGRSVDRAQGAAQQQSPVANASQRKQPSQFKQSKSESVDQNAVPSADEVELWAVALSEEATSATDKQDLQRRIFNFLTLCKQHIEGKQVIISDIFAYKHRVVFVVS